jgi:hypothetical protein
LAGLSAEVLFVWTYLPMPVIRDVAQRPGAG